MKKISLLSLGILMISHMALAQTYTIDKYHTRVGFSANHFGISQVEGNFKIFDASMVSKRKDFTDAVISFTAQVASISTDVEYRDNDLKGREYFDAVKYPEISFKSIAFKRINAKDYVLIGNLTIHGISRQMAFSVRYNGTAITAMKQPTVGFTITGSVNRLDFGLGGDPLKTGVGNKVALTANTEFTISK